MITDETNTIFILLIFHLNLDNNAHLQDLTPASLRGGELRGMLSAEWLRYQPSSSASCRPSVSRGAFFFEYMLN